MTDPNLFEVGIRLEEAVRRLSDGQQSNEKLYDIYERVAIQILDSEHEDYPAGVLELYLTRYLDSLRSKK